MSIYRPDGKPFFLYDFQHRGKRYHGSTGQRSRRAAEAYEDRVRREVAEGKHGEAAQLTLDRAAGKWFAEVGSKLATAKSVEIRLENLLTLYPKGIRLCELTTAHVSEAIQRRQGQGFTRAPDKDAKVYLPANATVNRDVIGTTRSIYNRAIKNWDAKGLNAIRWADLKLKEPAAKVRTYPAAERAAWRAECGPTVGLFLECLLTYGPRLAEWFFPLDAFDPDAAVVAIKKRKRDVPLIIALRADHAAEFRARLSRALESDLDTLWFLDALDDRSGEIKLESISYHGMVARLKSAARRAGVKPGRLIHSTRHHAGTAMMAKTQNLRAAQRLLGHSDIRSTTIYTHVDVEDLRAAVEGMEVVPTAGGREADRRRRK